MFLVRSKDCKDVPMSVEKLKAIGIKNLNSVLQNIVQNLVDSIPKQISLCKQNKSAITRY